MAGTWWPYWLRNLPAEYIAELLAVEGLYFVADVSVLLMVFGM